MAKRMKLNNSGASSGVQSQEKIYHIQELLLVPDAEKLIRLDKELSDVLKRTDLQLEEKVRLFEEKLAMYRRAREQLIRRGGTSELIPRAPNREEIKKKEEDAEEDAEEDTEEYARVFRMEVRKAVEELLAERDEEEEERKKKTPQRKTPSAKKRRRDSNDSLGADRFESADEDFDDTMLQGNISVETPSILRPSGRSTPKEDSRKKPKNLENLLYESLKATGVRSDKKKVFFSPGVKKDGYTISSVNQVMKYLTGANPTVQQKLHRLVKIVCKRLREKSDDYDNLVATFPLLAKFDQDEELPGVKQWDTMN